MERSETARVDRHPAGYTGPLAKYDAVLMAGVRPGAQTLSDWLGTMAWDADSVPTSFEAVSYGLHRLVRAGLIQVERPDGRASSLRIRPTEAGMSLLRRARPARYARGEVAERIEGEFAARSSLVGDRSLGPLPNLSLDEWNHEYRKWDREFARRATPWLALSRLLQRYLRWRHPSDFPT
jgi:DNA-binding MarR family transcriptional regulator